MLLLLLHYFEIKQQKNTTNNSKLLWQQKKTENTHALTHALHTWMCRASHKWDGHLAETNRNTFFFDQVFNQVCIMNGTVCGSKNVCVLRRLFILLKFLFILHHIFYCWFISSSDSKSKILHKSNRQHTHTLAHTSVYNSVCYAIFNI